MRALDQWAWTQPKPSPRAARYIQIGVDLVRVLVTRDGIAIPEELIQERGRQLAQILMMEQDQ